MRIGASDFLLRGVKRGSFLLASIVFVSIISIIHSQPAKAGGFLLDTVRCVLGTVLQAECQPRQPVSPSFPTAPQSTRPASPAAPSEPQASGQPQTTQGTPADTQIESVPPIVTGEPIDTSGLTQIEIEHIAQGVMSDSAQFGRQDSRAYIPYIGFNPYGGDQTDARNEGFAVITSSREGWIIAGVAWYWWTLIIGVIAGVVMGRRYYLFKKSSGLSKVQ